MLLRDDGDRPFAQRPVEDTQDAGTVCPNLSLLCFVVPPIKTIFVQGEKPINIAYGAKGCGEIATIPTAPAVAGAYYKLDGKIRNKLPMSDTFYKRF